MLSQEKYLVIPDNPMSFISLCILFILLFAITIVVYIINMELNKQKCYELILIKEEALRKKEAAKYRKQHWEAKQLHSRILKE